MKKVPVNGGSPQTLCELGSGASRSNANGGTWNRDGVIVFATSRAPLQRVSAAGGVAKAATSLEQPGDLTHIWPQFLADGRHVLYFAVSKDSARTGAYVQELGSTQRVLGLKTLFRAVWAPPGPLLFIQEDTLFAQRMNPKTFQLEGEPAPIAEEVANNESNGRSPMAVSENGVLMYRGIGGVRNSRLTWLDREGKPLGTVGQPGDYVRVRPSPDEKHVALTVRSGAGKWDFWLMDLATGVMARLTHDGKSSTSGMAWSPDSRRLALNRAYGDVSEMDLASGKTTVLNDRMMAMDWSPDGSSLICHEAWRGGAWFALPVAAGAKPQRLEETPGGIFDFRFSPDGKFVTYASGEAGRVEVYVAAYPAFAPKRQISNGGGEDSQWRGDGRELFYGTRSGSVMSVDIRTGPVIDAGIPKVLLKTAGRVDFAAAADGKRFLLAAPVDTAPPPDVLMAVLNWSPELKQ